MSQGPIIEKSSDPGAHELREIKNRLKGVKEELEGDLNATLGLEPEISPENIYRLKDNFFGNLNFSMVNMGEGDIGVSDSTVNRISSEARNQEIDISKDLIGKLRHELAHEVDNKLNREIYDEKNVEGPGDVRKAPKEAYAIFEASKVGEYNFPEPGNGWQIPRDWNKMVGWEGKKISLRRNPHRLGEHSARIIERAGYEKHGDDRMLAEKYARSRLLEATTIEELLEYIEKSKQILEEPFYHRILEKEFDGLYRAPKEEVEGRLRIKNRKETQFPESYDLEAFYRDSALITAYNCIYDQISGEAAKLAERFFRAEGQNVVGKAGKTA